MRSHRLFAAVVLSWASAALAGEVVLFDAARDAVRLEKGELVCTGRWDLSDCDRLVVTFKDAKTANESYSLKLFNANGDYRARRGVYAARLVVRANGMRDESVRLPPELGTWREIETRLFSIRHFALAAQVWDFETKDAGFFAARHKGGIVCDMVDLKRVVKLTIGLDAAAKFRPERIRRIVATGTARDASKIVSWARLGPKGFFPWIDRYGQFKHREWAGKVKADADLKRARDEEEKDLAAHPRPAEFDKWGGWLKGPQLEATGHFRTEKIGGKWWMVDPDGRLWWSHGPLRVTPSSAVTPLARREYWFEGLPPRDSAKGEFYSTRDELLWPSYEKRGVTNTFDFSACNIALKYGPRWRTVWADLAHRRLASWGCNTIANSSDRDICLMDRTPYCDRFELKCRPIEKAKGVWWPFRDPFDPGFREEVRRQMKLHAREMADPWCFGFFVDNELEWGGETSLGEWTWASSADQPARIEFVRRLKAKYGSVPDKPSNDDFKEFSVALCEAYFKSVREEFKKAAPHKLYLGCRYAGGFPKKFALAASAKYADVVSFNIYRRDLSDYAWWSKAFDKPVLIGEFHSGSLDRGLLSPGIVHVKDQTERAAVYRQFVTSALRNPLVVGVHWHQFSDQPTSGRFDGENLQCGWTDVCDTPYREIIGAVREMGASMYRIRWGDGK